MTAPLITVRGDLLLPSLNPMANQFAMFGREWTLTAPRPALNVYEIAVYAAYCLTGYVDASTRPVLPLRYQPVSFWGQFARIREPAAPITAPLASPPVAASSETDEPAFSVHPAHIPRTVPASGNGRMFLGGGIALGSVALIGWMLLSPARTNKPVIARTQVAAPAKVADTPSIVPKADTPTIVAKLADTAPLTTKAVDTPTIVASAVATSETPVARGAVEAKPIAVAAKPARAINQRHAKAAEKTTQTATRAHAGARGAQRIPTTVQDIDPSASRKPARRALVSVRVPVADVPARMTGRHAIEAAKAADAIDATPRRVVVARDVGVSAGRAADRSLSSAELYGMLQHSPTLDDNSAPTSGRASAGVTAERLSHRRITDAPAEFSK